MVRPTCIHRKHELTLFDVLESIKKKSTFNKTGALGIFVGVVRGETTNGQPVKTLHLEAYEEAANKALNGICADLRNRTDIVDVQIHHFIGDFAVSDELVYVVVAGAHRTDVFPVLEEAVERYKQEAHIWKKETLEGGTSYWVSEPH